MATFYALFDVTYQGHPGNGLLGVFSTLDLANNIKGDIWMTIKSFEIDKLFPEGIEHIFTIGNLEAG